MPYHGHHETYYDPTDSSERAAIVEDAVYEAKKSVDGEYPHAVIRNPQDVTKFAELVFQEWIAYLLQQVHSYKKEKYNKHLAEMKRLYVSAFVSQYLEAIAEKDKKTGKTHPSTATSSALKGATVVLKDVKHNADECVYLLRIEDPEFIEPYEQELVLSLGEVITSPTTSSYGSSGTSASGLEGAGGYAEAGYEIPRPQTSRKPRRVTGSYFRKPR